MGDWMKWMDYIPSRIASRRDLVDLRPILTRLDEWRETCTWDYQLLQVVRKQACYSSGIYGRPEVTVEIKKLRSAATIGQYGKRKR